MRWSHELDDVLLAVLLVGGVEGAELELGAVGVDADDDPAVGGLRIEGVGDGGQVDEWEAGLLVLGLQPSVRVAVDEALDFRIGG